MGKNSDIGRSLALITQLGISMLVPIFLCLAAGLWLDQKFDTWFTLPFLILGFLAGGRNVWILAKQMQNRQSSHRKRPDYDLRSPAKTLNSDGTKAEKGDGLDEK